MGICCSFCGKEATEGQKMIKGEVDGKKSHVCYPCVKAINLDKTPDGVSLHPSLKELTNGS